MNQRMPLTKSITAGLAARNQTTQWETLLAAMLKRLELDEFERARAEIHYNRLAQHIARKLHIADTDVHVIVQGSMRTQTTISPRGNAKFDLDIVVKLTGSHFTNIDSNKFFAEFGKALEGLADTAGEPMEKRRCWRLQYPNEPFYFDVTPAIPGSQEITETDLRVRDPQTKWSPSNPEEFADWFCTIADQRFAFQSSSHMVKAQEEAEIDPFPDGDIALDDILRRAVQLMKLHRDNFYHELPLDRKEAKPISVILVTLAGHAYKDLYAAGAVTVTSPIEAVLELVERLPRNIYRDAQQQYSVKNPVLESENFADRWNQDGGRRVHEFTRWHDRLLEDLELFFGTKSGADIEDRIRSVFGVDGVEAWKKTLPKASNVLQGLLATAPTQPRQNPTKPTPSGSRHTFG